MHININSDKTFKVFREWVFTSSVLIWKQMMISPTTMGYKTRWSSISAFLWKRSWKLETIIIRQPSQQCDVCREVLKMKSISYSSSRIICNSESKRKTPFSLSLERMCTFLLLSTKAMVSLYFRFAVCLAHANNWRVYSFYPHANSFPKWEWCGDE